MTFNFQEWFSNEVYFTYYQAPTVLAIIPKEGPLKGGNTVIVIGRNYKFSKSIKCRFGNQEVKGKFVNDKEIKCIVPQYTKPGLVPFSISISPNIWSGGRISYNYLQQPELISVSPICGDYDGSTEIFITGKNFFKGFLFFWRLKNKQKFFFEI